MVERRMHAGVAQMEVGSGQNGLGDVRVIVGQLIGISMSADTEVRSLILC